MVKLAPSTLAVCDCSQLTTTPSREHVPWIAELRDSLRLLIINYQLLHYSSIYRQSHSKASGTPEIRVQGAFNTTAFLVYVLAQAATAKDRIGTYSCQTDATGIIFRLFMQVQINAGHHNLCLPHVHPQNLLLHL